MDQPFSLIAAHIDLGILGLLQGHFARAAVAFRSGMEIGHTWDVRITWPWGDAGLACALALQDQREDAIRMLEHATTVHGTSARYSLAQRFAWLGEAARSCGRPQEARRHAHEALRLARAHKERGNEAWALRLLGDLASDRERLSEAEGHYREALSQAEALGMRPLIAHCHQGLGGLSRRTGGLDRARRELGVARDLYQDMAMTVWLERTNADLTELG